jgi:hypothetical protein
MCTETESDNSEATRCFDKACLVSSESSDFSVSTGAIRKLHCNFSKHAVLFVNNFLLDSGSIAFMHQLKCRVRLELINCVHQTQ